MFSLFRFRFRRSLVSADVVRFPLVPPVRSDFADKSLTSDTSPMTRSEMVSGDRATEQMTVLHYRSRKDREVDLAVIVDRHDAHDRFRRFVSGKQQHSGLVDTYLRCRFRGHS